MMKVFQIIVSLLTLSAFVSNIGAIENTNNSMTSGTFGVAWLNSDGYVQVFDGVRFLALCS
ncbi:hypothetical protein FACS189419_09830 [Planctomycetales bacterium]|nr:hypothetical protein FACS189419_09830 [Planctomycetales bacterium]